MHQESLDYANLKRAYDEGSLDETRLGEALADGWAAAPEANRNSSRWTRAH